MFWLLLLIRHITSGMADLCVATISAPAGMTEVPVGRAARFVSPAIVIPRSSSRVRSASAKNGPGSTTDLLRRVVDFVQLPVIVYVFESGSREIDGSSVPRPVTQLLMILMSFTGGMIVYAAGWPSDVGWTVTSTQSSLKFSPDTGAAYQSP